MAFPIIGAVALAALAFLALSDKKTEGEAKPEVEPKEPELNLPSPYPAGPQIPGVPLPQIPGMPTTPQPGVCLLDASIPPDIAAVVNQNLSVPIARESWTTQLDAAAAALQPFYPMAAGCLRARAAELRGK